MNSPHPFADSAELIRSRVFRRFYRLIQPLVERFARIDGVNAVYRELQRPGITPREFCEEGLLLLGSEVLWPDDTVLASWRAVKGPLVVMANHPYGATDSLALMLLLERIRPGGWRLLSSRTLSRAPELAPHLIAVEPFEPSAPVNRTGLRKALRFLAEGGIVAAFPAGRVSGWNPEKTLPLDLPWSDHLARLASVSGASVGLIHFPGHNSLAFMSVPLRWPKLRALLLAREIMRPGKNLLQFDLGPVLEPRQVTKMVRNGNAGAKLHARCHLIPEIRHEHRPGPPRLEVKRTVAPPQDDEETRAEAESLANGPCHLFDQRGFTALLFQKSDAPRLFFELSRLREITFRAAGQGSGEEVDVTPEDDYYHQLVLWDSPQKRLVGAYRLGFTEDVIRDRGAGSLYLSHVFHIHPEFFQRIGPAAELTRSFIHPDYQGDPLALALLWRGLGQVIAARPRITSLFGSVTVPSNVSAASRGILVEYLRRYHHDDRVLCDLIRARSPFSAPGLAHALVAAAHGDEPIEALRDTIQNPDGTPHRIPPLIRHYLSMNARFIDFHVEKDFGDALYCLLRVDLRKSPLPHLRRFFGETAATRLHTA